MEHTNSVGTIGYLIGQALFYYFAYRVIKWGVRKVRAKRV